MNRLSSILILLTILVSRFNHAEPVPKLNSLSRQWVQRGMKTELTIYGENLARVTNMMITGAPGVTGGFLIAADRPMAIESTGSGVGSIKRPEVKSATLTLDVATNAVLTERELRVFSLDGVSNPLTFQLSPYRELESRENHSRESAQALEMPVAMSGTINGAAESDFFRFTAAKGEVIVADVYAYRLGSKLDSSLAIYDKGGKELARSEDAVALDSVLRYEIPGDGEYYLELRDFRYAGGGDFKYRMIVGVLPHVSRFFPYGAQRGQTIDIALEGSNLDSKTLTLSLAPDATPGRQELRAATAKGLSNPFALIFSDTPQFNEKEPNSALDQADRVQTPVAINGKIGAKKDYDAFRFRADAGQRIVFDVSASRFGSPLDALLTLTDASGNVLVRNDDNAGEDARVDYTFRTAGDYFIILEDLLGRGTDEFGYHLTIEKPLPDFSATLARDTPQLRRGGRIPLRCEVNRLNGFSEPVSITCEDLPSGVHAEPLFLPPEAISGFLVLNADASAPLGSFPIKLIARGNGSTHEAEVMAGDKPCLQAFLTVLEPAPFTIFPATLMSSVDQNQTAAVEVLVERRNGFNGEIVITAEGFSSGREPISKHFDVQRLTLKGGESRGTLSLKTKIDSDVGIRHIYLRGESSGIVEYSPLIPVGTAQIPFVLSTSLKNLIVTALPSGSSSAAAEAAFSAKLQRRDGYEGEVELKLDGLPSGVTLALINIAAKSAESAIRLVATDKAPTGTNVQLTLTAVGQHKDRIYRFQAPPITLTINAPEAEEKPEPKLANKQ